MTDSPSEVRTFHWSECRAALAGLEELPRDERGRFAGAGVLVKPPLVFPVSARCVVLRHWLDDLPAEPGRHAIVLAQAGAVSLGRFAGGEEAATKSFKRYVVRGNGKAQGKHLQAKGKSKYGSRLRLQNARRLEEETREKLLEWEAEHGGAELVFANGGRTLVAELLGEGLPEAYGPERRVAIPRDVPRPTTKLLRLAYRSLCWGRIEPWPGPLEGADPGHA